MKQFFLFIMVASLSFSVLGMNEVNGPSCAEGLMKARTAVRSSLSEYAFICESNSQSQFLLSGRIAKAGIANFIQGTQGQIWGTLAGIKADDNGEATILTFKLYDFPSNDAHLNSLLHSSFWVSPYNGPGTLAPGANREEVRIQAGRRGWTLLMTGSAVVYGKTELVDIFVTPSL